MNLLWKLLAGCALVLTLLCAPGEAHAVLKGSDGQCTPGYHPDPNDPNECIVDATELKKVWITGNTPLNWSFDSAFFGISDYNRVALERGAGVSESGVRGKREQELQQSTCDGNGKGASSNVAAGALATDRPVLIAAGTKLQPEGDIAPTGDGVALALVRTYNSDSTKIGAFGQGWSSSIDYTLVLEYDGLVCWAYLDRNEPCAPNGKPLLKVHAYGPSGYATHFSPAGGIWTSGSGDVAQLVSGEWLVDYVDGSHHVFSANGKPKSVLNERGIGLTYVYSASDQLASVVHTSGRSLALTWSGQKIVIVAAPNSKLYSYTYTSSGHLGSVTYPDNLGTRTYRYENQAYPGRLTGITVNGERYSQYNYLTDGRVAASGLDQGIERSTFAYYSDRTVVTNAIGQATTYYVATVDGVKRISGIDRPATGTCTAGAMDTQYNLDGTVDYQVDALGVTKDFSYDSDHRPTQIISGIGLNGETDQQQITQYVWDSVRKGRLNQVNYFGSSTSNLRNTTSYAYYSEGDARARLLQSVSVTNQAAGGGSVGTLTTTYDYTLHPNGLVATMTVDGPLTGTADSVVSTFDTAGNLLTVGNSLNHTTTYANYNALGQPGTMTLPNGAVTTYTYNARGQVLTQSRTVNGAVQTTTTTYDTRGRPSAVLTPDGDSLESNYDAFDRLTSVVKYTELADMGDEYDRNETRTQVFTYNLLSRLLTGTTTYRYAAKIWDEFRQRPISVGHLDTQRKITYEYDAGGFLNKQIGEHGQTTTYHYNANGDVEWVQDALGNATSYTYDRHRRVSSVTDANNGVTVTRYNALGQINRIQDPRNNVTAYSYDGLGNMLSQSSPDSGMTVFSYNAVGQRIQMRRADLSLIDYTYDALGRLTTVSSGGQTRTLAYDTCTNGKGLLCSAVKTGGTTTMAAFAYTPWGQMATRQDVLNSVTDTTAYSYDGMLRLAGISYPSGISVGYAYSEGNLSLINATVNGTTATIATPSDYIFFGPSVYMTYGNGLWRTNNYDTDGRLTGISTSYGNPIQSLTYGFDAADRITAITDGIDANMTQQFQYDGLSRLTRAEVPGGNISTFGHDPVGNRTSVVETSPASTTTYAIAATGNQMTQAVTGGMVRPFTYNANGDVATLVGLSGVTNTLTYDPFGRLASHTRAQLTTTYTVNALDQRMAKSNTGSSSRYVYAGFNQLLAEYTNGQWTSYIWNGNAPVAMVRNNQIYYIHTDHLGRPQLATDANRAVVWKASNHAFGRTVAVDAIGGLPLGFPGQYHDTEFGTWHNGYRDYLADTGRYLQSDPIGLAGGINTYAYVGGNPVMYIDPFGLHCMTPEQIGERVGAIEGGIAGAQEGPVGALLGGIAGAVIGRATADLGQLPGAIAAGAGGMVQMAGEGKAGMARGGLSAFVGTAGAASMGPGGAALGPIVGEIASPSSASLAIAISNVMKTSMFAVAGAAAGVAYKKLAEATRDSDCECNQGK